MEAKLSSYRSQKRRQAILNTFKDRLYNMVSFQQVRVDEKSTHVIVEADVSFCSNSSAVPHINLSLPDRASTQTEREHHSGSQSQVFRNCSEKTAPSFGIGIYSVHWKFPVYRFRRSSQTGNKRDETTPVLSDLYHVSGLFLFLGHTVCDCD